jgi:predicted phosphodiesterase
MLAMEEAGVELVLTGHHHLAGHSESRAFAVEGPRRVVVVRAGTAISMRGRGERNSYNLVEAGDDSIRVERRDWDGDGFAAAATQEYPRRR